MQATETFDASARKFHQAVCVIALAAAFVLGANPGGWLAVAIGLILFGGRFWWPLDLFRQLAWRVLEPAGILPRHDVVEDHKTRRVARVLGGLVLVASGIELALLGQPWGWILVGLMAVMIFLDAAFDF